MSKNDVFQTTRVRTPLKNDLSWIHKLKEEKERQEKTSGDPVTSPVRQSSYVLATAQIFETQTLKEELVQYTEAQPEKSAPETKDQTNAEQIEKDSEASVSAPVDDIQNIETEPVSEENPEAISVVEAAQAVSNPVSDASADQSYVEHNEETAQSSPVVIEEVVKNNEAQPEKSASVETAEQAVTNVLSEKKEEEVDEADAKVGEAEVGTQQSQAAEEVTTAAKVELTPEAEPPTQTEPENVTTLLDAGVESTVQPAEEICEECPQEQAPIEIVETIAETVVESVPESPAVINQESAEGAAMQDSVEAVPDLLADVTSESPTQPPAETVVKSVESRLESAAPAEPFLNIAAEKESESEVQAVKQDVEPTPAITVDDVVGLKTDAAEPVRVPEVEAAEDTLVEKTIELEDAFDVAAPTVTAVPESHSEELKLIQQSDDANTNNMFQKLTVELPSIKTRDGKPVCSFCDQIIDGDVKISLSEPPVSCHPDCLKCGVCDKALGDLLTLMFLHDQRIHCDGCFAKALQT
ncbi:uncharacterized protein ACBR49_010207 [Aulostomus maculatus]